MYKTLQQFCCSLYAAWMVQYPDSYLFRRWLLAALRPSLQEEVLCRGITVEFNSMQDILEKVKDIEDSLQYDIGSQMSVDGTHSNAYANQNMVQSSKWMIGAAPRGTAGQTMANRQVPKPIQNTSSNTCKIPEATGKQPWKKVNKNAINVARKDTCNLSVWNWGAST